MDGWVGVCVGGRTDGRTDRQLFVPLLIICLSS
jgi:hypothetical protein